MNKTRKYALPLLLGFIMLFALVSINGFGNSDELSKGTFVYAASSSNWVNVGQPITSNYELKDFRGDVIKEITFNYKQTGGTKKILGLTYYEYKVTIITKTKTLTETVQKQERFVNGKKESRFLTIYANISWKSSISTGKNEWYPYRFGN